MGLRVGIVGYGIIVGVGIVGGGALSLPSCPSLHPIIAIQINITRII